MLLKQAIIVCGLIDRTAHHFLSNFYLFVEVQAQCKDRVIGGLAHTVRIIDTQTPILIHMMQTAAFSGHI